MNHFIPFTEDKVGAPDRFESAFMAEYIAEKELSAQASAVLAEGRKLWQAYFKIDFNHTIRSDFKLNRCDVGWYQIRMALKTHNESGEHQLVYFGHFDNAYKTLTEKLRPQVYSYGFLAV